MRDAFRRGTAVGDRYKVVGVVGMWNGEDFGLLFLICFFSYRRLV
jgi:hypothetical protein